METNKPNQSPTPTPPNTQPTNTPPTTQTPPPTPKTKKPYLLISLVILLLSATGVLGYKYYQVKQQLDSQPTPPPQLVVSSPSPIVSPTTEVDPTANWKTYTNTEYGYSIKHPTKLTVGENGMSRGNTEIATAIVLYEEGDSSNFESPRFAITVRFDSTNFENISNNHYQKLTTNKLSESDKKAAQENLGYLIADNKAVKPIVKTSFNNLPAYQYTISGSTIDDGAAEYGVSTENHHYIWIEKGNSFYLISFTDNEIMNQILSTFKFTN